MDTAEARIAELEAEVSMLHDAIIGMDVAIVDGYFVLVWPENDVWIASCRNVGIALDMDTREEVLQAVADDIPIVLEALAELGTEPPAKDITTTTKRASHPFEGGLRPTS